MNIYVYSDSIVKPFFQWNKYHYTYLFKFGKSSLYDLQLQTPEKPENYVQRLLVRMITIMGSLLKRLPLMRD